MITSKTNVTTATTATATTVLDLLRARQSCRVFAAAPAGTVAARAAEALRALNTAAATPATLQRVVTPGADASVVALARDAPWAVRETAGMVRGPKHWAAVVQHAGAARRGGLAAGVLLERATIALAALGLGAVTIADPRLAAAFPELAPARLPRGSSVATMLCYGVPDAPALRAEPRTPRRAWAALFYDGAWRVPLTKARALAAAGTPLLAALDAVRVGQSAFNTQPWRVVLEKQQPSQKQSQKQQGGALHFFFEEPRPGSGVPPGLNPRAWAGLDLGVAVANFDAVARESGLRGTWAPPSPAPAHEQALVARLGAPQSAVLHYATWVPASA